MWYQQNMAFLETNLCPRHFSDCCPALLRLLSTPLSPSNSSWENAENQSRNPGTCQSGFLVSFFLNVCTDVSNTTNENSNNWNSGWGFHKVSHCQKGNHTAGSPPSLLPPPVLYRFICLLGQNYRLLCLWTEWWWCIYVPFKHLTDGHASLQISTREILKIISWGKNNLIRKT